MNQDLILRLIIEAVDQASGNLSAITDKVGALKKELLSSEFTRTAEGLDAIAPKIDALTQPSANAAGSVLALNAALATIATLMAGKAYDASAQYESALADVAKVMDGGADEAAQYGTQLDALALKYGQNGQALLQTFGDFVQAGYSASESVKLVENAIQLMIAGDVSAAAASADLVAILKGFDAPAGDAARAVDILNEVSNKYATDVTQLAAGMAGLAPIAHQLGFSFEETAGLLTPIIEVFGSGTEAAEAMKTTLLRLSDDSKPVVAALDQLGVSQRDANGALRSGHDIFLDVAKALGTLSAADRTYLTQQLTGIDQAAKATVIFGDFAKYLDVTATAAQSSGSALAEVERQLGGAENAGKRADESFRQLAVSIGNQFRPEVAAVVSASAELGAALRSALDSGQLAPLIGALTPQITSLQTLIGAVADNLDRALAGVNWQPLVAGLGSVSGALGEAFRLLTSGFDLTTVAGLRDALQAVVNVLGNFAQTVGGVVDGLGPFFSTLNTVFGLVTQSRPAFSALIGEITGTGAAINLTIPTILEIGSALFGLVGKIVNVAAEIGLLVIALNALNSAGLPIGPMLRGLVGILGELAGLFLRMPAAMAGLLSALAGFPGLVAAATAATGALGYGIGSLINRFVEWATGGDSLGTALYRLTSSIGELSQELLGSQAAAQPAMAATRDLTAAAVQAATAEDAARAARQAHNQALLDEAQYQADLAAAIARVTVTQQGQADLLGQVSTRADQMVAAFNGAIAAGKGLDEATKATLGSLNLLNAADLGGVLNAIGRIGSKSHESGQAVRDALMKAIDDLDARSLGQLIGTIGQIQQSAVTSGEAVRDVLGQAIRTAGERLGVDVGQALTGISDKTRENLLDFENLRKSVQGMGLDSQASGRLLSAALLEITKSADTKQELEAVRAAARNLGQDGAASIGQVVQVLQAVEQQAVKTGNSTMNLDGVWSKAAREITQAEYDKAAAFNRAQAAADQQTQSTQELSTAQQHANSDTQQATVLYDAMGAALIWLDTVSKQTSDQLRNSWGDLKASPAMAVLAFKDLNFQMERVKTTQQSVSDLTRRIQEATASGEDLAWAAKQSSAQFSILDKTQLKGLNDAIDAAKSRMDSLNDSVGNTLRNLKNELDTLEGRKAAVEQRDYEAKKIDLEAQLDEARKAGANKAVADLQEALRVLDQIHAKKMAALKGREHGGEVRAGETVLVGEKRPEVVTFGRDGYVHPSVGAFQDAMNKRGGAIPTFKVELAGHDLFGIGDPDAFLKTLERQARAG